MTGPRGEHTHRDRASRDDCAQGKCNRHTVLRTWPNDSHLETLARNSPYQPHVDVHLLNNIEVVQFWYGDNMFPIEYKDLDDYITTLLYAKWYFETGKYDENVVTR